MEQDKQFQITPEQMLERLQNMKQKPDGRFAFLINPLEKIPVFQILAEESSSFDTLQKAAEYLDVIPKVKPAAASVLMDNSSVGPNAPQDEILAFTLFLNQTCDVYTEEDYRENFYLAEIEEAFPNSRVLYAWGTCPPADEEYYALVEFTEEKERQNDSVL